RFRHDSIAASAQVRGEHIMGWTAHYLTGIAFATLFIGIWGLAWMRHPAIGPALAFGIGTVAAPFLLMQPGMGAGIAASRTPSPGSARLQSLITHAVFGLGLYATGRRYASSIRYELNPGNRIFLTRPTPLRRVRCVFPLILPQSFLVPCS